MRVEVEVLGSLRVRVSGEVLPQISGRGAVLLSRLALSAGQVVAADTLADCIWGERLPTQARASLSNQVMRLRRVLRAPIIESAPPGYLLRIAPGDVDVLVFRRMVAESRSLPDDRARDLLRRALLLWRGDPLAGLQSEAFQREDAPALAEERIAALERRIELDVAAGAHAEVVPELRELTTRHPLRETAVRLLIMALVRCGRRAEAVMAYHEMQGRLRTELGIDPSGELRAAFRGLLGDETDAREGNSGRGSRCTCTGESTSRRPATTNPDSAGEREATLGISRQLPAKIADLVGRETEAAGVVGQLGARGGEPLAVVSGPGGVGKSVLAVECAHRLVPAFPDGQLYVDLRRAGTSIALACLLRGLGLHDQTMPRSSDERVALYRSLTASRKVLVVLDNVVDESQMNLLLPAGSGSAAIITGRARMASLPGAHRIDLGALDEQGALDLLARIVGQDRLAAEPEEARSIARSCAGLPLALRIAGARLAARPRRRLATLAGRLLDDARRLAELRHGELDLRSCLALGYRPLPQQAKRLLCRVSIFDVPTFPAHLGADLLGITVAEAERLLEDLVDARLLDTADDQEGDALHYRIHDLVRLYARDQGKTEDMIRENEPVAALKEQNARLVRAVCPNPRVGR